MLGAAIAGGSIARSAAAAATGGAAGTAMESIKLLQERISVLDAANAAGNGSGRTSSVDFGNTGAGTPASSGNITPSSSGSAFAGGWSGDPMNHKPVGGIAAAKPETNLSVTPSELEDPPLDHPITPDEARGFGPDGNLKDA
jgi:hypothetical protein